MGFWIGLNIVDSVLVKNIGIKIISFYYITSISLTVFFFPFNAYLTRIMDNNTFLFIFFGIVSFLLFFSSFLPMLSWSNILISAIIIIIVHPFLFSILLSKIWNLITQIFHPLQLRRLNLFFSLSPIFSGILGNLITMYAAIYLGSNLFYVLVLIWSGLMFLCFYLIYKNYIKTINISFNQPGYSKVNNSILSNFKSELFYYWGNQLAMSLLLISFLFGIATALIGYQFIYIANLAYKNDNEVANFLSYLGIVQFISILLFLAIFQNKMFIKLGVSKSLFVIPICGVIGYTIIFFFFNFWVATIFYFMIYFLFYIFHIQASQVSFSILEHQQLARTFGAIATALGTGIGGITLIFIPNQYQWFISLIGLISCILWLWINFLEARYYRQTILNNLQNKKLFGDTLESLENINDQELNEKLKNILIDKKGMYTIDDKLKVVDSIQAFNNVNLIRELVFLLDSPNYEMRIAGIKALKHLFVKVSKNPIIHYQIQRSMKNLLKRDPVDLVRAHAALFFLKHTSQEDLPAFFIDFIVHHKNPAERLIVYKTLKNIKIEYIDFLLKDGLQDEDPRIRGEIVTSLWKYRDYHEINLKIISSLLNSSKYEDYHAGLKTIALIGAEIDFIEEANRFLKHPDPKINILAALYLMHKVSRNDHVYQELTSIILNGILDPTIFKSEDWREFVALLVEMEEDEIIDMILISLQEQSKSDPRLVIEMNYLAEYMSKKMIEYKYWGFDHDNVHP